MNKKEHDREHNDGEHHPDCEHCEEDFKRRRDAERVFWDEDDAWRKHISCRCGVSCRWCRDERLRDAADLQRKIAKGE